MKLASIPGYTLLALVSALIVSGCNAYFVPSLGLLRQNGGVFCWTPIGSESPQSCQSKLPRVSLYQCTQELRPTATWRTTSDIAPGRSLKVHGAKGLASHADRRRSHCACVGRRSNLHPAYAGIQLRGALLQDPRCGAAL
jgi:hypothetical protein